MTYKREKARSSGYYRRKPLIDIDEEERKD